MTHSTLNLLNKVFTKKNNPINYLLSQSQNYLSPLLKELHKTLDLRLVKTFNELFHSILENRNNTKSLLLTELGTLLSGNIHGNAGVKRIGKLIRSHNWCSSIISEFFRNKSYDRISSMLAEKVRPILIWDGSVLEKHESIRLEGLSAVDSSRAKRLVKIKPGYYNPPVKGFIHVPGFKVEGVVLTALSKRASLFEFNVYSRSGLFKEWWSNFIWRGFKKLHNRFHNAVLHVFDRGYANVTVLEFAERFEQSFLVRWMSNKYLIDEKGKRLTHHISRGMKNKSFKVTFDKERKKYARKLITWKKVKHPDMKNQEYTLIVIREYKRAGSPIYLLTNLVIETKNQAWEMLFSYMKRWEVEEMFRCCKAELGLQSIRVQSWEVRLKLINIALLVYEFLMEIIQKKRHYVERLINIYAPLFGRKRNKSPFYRLRKAFASIISKWKSYAEISYRYNPIFKG
ncbi:transposase [Flammeovirga sp. MY04]|uniref:transposase n=1 Tax=Flammeovirga sp. MY04 TaxID=1191459 RepID=UPI000806273B|nr:transposase [Flammeovirga sp. MY04]ANQ47401.1 transposase [Flammeovirga sp. MY04]ANQ48132.1 transposase [Flammeovirga sp. MY04]ANQ48728.1 transposase [Flammeovirga sp. MY04]ANQ48733.1 transposase [Flammeovirga sp. MY04]